MFAWSMQLMFAYYMPADVIMMYASSCLHGACLFMFSWCMLMFAWFMLAHVCMVHACSMFAWCMLADVCMVHA